MTKTERLDELFTRWKKTGFKGEKFKVFCEDGIIDEETYNDEAIKVLFVLKDVNNAKPEENVDLRKNLKKLEGEGRTWFPIARWTIALLDAIAYSEEIDIMNSSKQHTHLKRAAVMNLKKEAGGAKVPDDCILCYADAHSKLIKEEVRIIKPDIIIACSSVIFEALQTKVFKVEKLEDTFVNKFNERMKSYGKCFDISSFIDCKKPVYVVEYRHPNQAGTQGTSKEHYENMLKIREHFFGK